MYAQEANIVQYSIESGLPQSQVNKTFFDSRGMLWVATYGGGISIFDGVKFNNIDESNGLAGNIVLDISEDNEGRIICVSTWGGITIINNNKIEKVIPYPEGLDGVSSVEKDGYGKIWIAGSEICYLENDEIKPIITDISLPFVSVPNMRTFGDKMYVTYNNKLLIVDVKTSKIGRAHV